jgi:multisubunit Na+/H+ antiporter MnhF subunit
MASSQHPVATHHLPAFITAPGQTDVLMVIMAVILLLAILGFGILFFRLHSLPERIAHKSQRLQFEIVAVLGLISLFTHMHIFWVIGLLLALIEFPDFGTPLGRIARSTEKIAGIDPVLTPTAPTLVPHEEAGEQARAAMSPAPLSEQGHNASASRPDAVPAIKRGRSCLS